MKPTVYKKIRFSPIYTIVVTTMFAQRAWRINRNIPQIIEESGFKIEQMEEMYLPKTPKIAGYNYWGYAIVNK